MDPLATGDDTGVTNDRYWWSHERQEILETGGTTNDKANTGATELLQYTTFTTG